MALKIPIEDFHFNQPAYLSEAEFWHIKKNLHLNPFYQMEPPHETTFEKFQGKIIGVGVALVIIFLCFNSDSEGLAAFGAITTLFGTLYAFKLAMDTLNYQQTVNIKKAYFSKMRLKIMESDDYSLFMKSFYHVS